MVANVGILTKRFGSGRTHSFTLDCRPAMCTIVHHWSLPVLSAHVDRRVISLLAFAPQLDIIMSDRCLIISLDMPLDTPNRRALDGQ